MTDVLVWLNALANTLGCGLGFIGWLPAWLSLTLVSVLSGTLMLVAFKATSNQLAIKRAHRQIRAGLLAVRLFPDSTTVGLRSQGEALAGALRLLALAVVPIAVMLVPVTLLLGQLALWYQARPLHVGEETVVTLTLDPGVTTSWPQVILEPHEAVVDMTGPVRVVSQHAICWGLRAREPGLHKLTFRRDGQTITKELAVGEGMMPVSLRRPGATWYDILLHPRETPCIGAVRAIDVHYPPRTGWFSGSGTWITSWFVASCLSGFFLRGLFRVQL